MNWEKNVRKVEPYIPGEQPKRQNIIKLNTNECPYPPAPGVKAALERIQYENFRLYPDANITELSSELAKYYHVNKEQVFVGVGSDDVLAMAFLTFFNSDKPVLFPDITYAFYDVWAELYGIPYKQIPLTDDFTIKSEDYLGENGGIVITNPNAPTGIYKEIGEIEEIIKANPDVVVIVDEAYVDFGGQSCIPLVEKYDNLLVVQTFSKSRSMAGMRIGFAVGQEKIIGYLQDAKFSFNSYTMNQPALAVGVESVRDDAYFKETVGKIINTRERMKVEFKKLGFEMTDSKTNFLFVTHPKVAAADIFNAAREEGIFVRYWNRPRINNYLRITIGTDEEMDTLISFLKKYLA